MTEKTEIASQIIVEFAREGHGNFNPTGRVNIGGSWVTLTSDELVKLNLYKSFGD